MSNQLNTPQTIDMSSKQSKMIINKEMLNVAKEDMLDEEESLNPDYVWETVIDVLEDYESWKDQTSHKGKTNKQFTEDMKKKYGKLFLNAPGIFTKCCNGDFQKDDEFDKLVYMLEMSRKIRCGGDTHENVEREVGKRFADEYVKPTIDKLEDKRLKKGKKGN
jgi:hypothetical protein